MRLRYQVLLFILTATIAAFMTTLYILEKHIQSSFQQLEQQQTLETSNSLEKLLEYDLKRLASATADWAEWDDSYRFILQPSTPYIESNLTADTLIGLGIDYLLYFDKNYQPVFAKTLNQTASELIPLDDQEEDVFVDIARQLQQQQRSAFSHYARIGENAVRFSVQRVTPSQPHDENDFSGYLIMASLIDNEMIDNFSQLINTPVFIAPQRFPQGLFRFESTPQYNLAFFTLYSYQQQPLLTLGITKKRVIITYAKNLKDSLFLPILLCATIIALLAIILFSQLVINPIALIRQQVQKFTHNLQDLPEINLSIHSELGILANDIQHMASVIQQTQAQLEDAVLAAESANRTKSEFIANMSHEIRTPMTAILGYSELLRNPDISTDERLQHQATIEKNAKQLLTIINEILDISKIEAGKFTVNCEKTELEPIFNQVISLLQLSAENRGLSLNLNYFSPIPETLNTDADRLQQVLINLVGNAIKFTHAGSINLNVEADVEQQLLSIDISDTGIGMSASTLEHIFKPFYQDESASNRQYQGTGLGLTISKALIEALGGKLSVDSEPGTGSTFSITLPYDADSAMVEGHTHCDQGNRFFAPRKKLEGNILIIDDNHMIALLVSKMLSNYGVHTYTESQPQMAIEKLLNNELQVDLILMDMQMPILDGYQATRILKENDFSTPIIAVTANSMTGDREKCLEAGCDAFLAKPIEQEKLYNACKRYLEK